MEGSSFNTSTFYDPCLRPLNRFSLQSPIASLIYQNEAGESLKNVILVMHSSNMLVPPPEGEDTRSEEQKKLWQDSSERIERILPGFLQEIGKG